MTPHELELILGSSTAISRDSDRFSAAFYDTVFEIAPSARALFPDDMTEQRKKLMRELRFMLGAAAALADPDQLEAFVARTQELGRRHVGYGVTSAMYEPVGAALISTLRDHADEFDDAHAQAWTKLFQFIAQTMLDGAATAPIPNPVAVEAVAAAPVAAAPVAQLGDVCMQCAPTIRLTVPQPTSTVPSFGLAPDQAQST